MERSDALDPLDRFTALPLYQQIKEEIAARIQGGRWNPGQKLPSENELVELLGVSRMTINRALRELTRDGLLVRVHGVGTFVAERRRHASLIQLRDIADEIREAGKSHRLQVLRLETVEAGPDTARVMALPSGSSVHRLVAVHYQDEVPVLHEDRVVNPALAPAFPEVDFTHMTATGYLVSIITPDEMEHIVQAVLPESEIAAALRIGRTEPCLKLSRRTFKGDEVVTSASLTYPGSRYSLGARYFTDDFRGRQETRERHR